MDRCWLLTWTTYGTWLPGDARGFVSDIADASGKGVRHNLPGTPCDADIPALNNYMRGSLKGDPVFLSAEHAAVLLPQFQETARFRGWLLLAVAIMANHVHVLVGVPGDPDPEDLLRDFKSYGSRALNRRWGKPPSGTWWTESGSRRKKAGEGAVRAAIQYVKDQPYPLLVWVPDDESGASGGHQASGGRQPPVEGEANEGAGSTDGATGG
jgi:REP element-mobilizing transposase RayT